jgi:hypothetical protein
MIIISLSFNFLHYMQEESEGNNSALSPALEEEDLETVVFENNLGSELYLRTFKDNFQKVTVVPAEQTYLIHLPPPKFPEKFMNAIDARQIRHYVVVHVSEARVRTWNLKPCSFGGMIVHFCFFWCKFE